MIKIHKSFGTIDFKPNDVFLHFTGNIFGIGCSSISEIAINRIIELKQSHKNKSHILLFSSIEQLSSYEFPLLTNLEVFNLIDKYSPGNLTVLLDIDANNLNYLHKLSQNNKVAIRIPKSKVLRDFIDNIGHPIISTSINISGNSLCTDLNILHKEFSDWFDYGLYDETEEADEPLPSTLIDIIYKDGKLNIIILRQGSVILPETKQ